MNPSFENVISDLILVVGFIRKTIWLDMHTLDVNYAKEFRKVDIRMLHEMVLVDEDIAKSENKKWLISRSIPQPVDIPTEPKNRKIVKTSNFKKVSPSA